MTAQPPPPGYPPQQPAGQQPDNYLVWSILTTLFCCLPLGVVAIVKSSQVSGLWAQGRYAEAQESADAAKKWVKWSVIAWVVGAVIYGGFLLVMALTADHSNAAALAALY
jgi:Interferon-induced transmembrane protein